MKVLTINVSNNDYDIKKKIKFSILEYSVNEHLKNKTYEENPLSEHNLFIMSSGPFTGLGLPGAHRAIISGRSPLTKGFFFSTIGGLGEEICRTSVDSIKIIGRAKNPSIILIKYENEKLVVKVEEVPELFELYEKKGVFSLQEWLANKYSSFFKKLRHRSIVAGPSGFNTNMGGLSSVRIKNNKLDYGSEGFAGRGGYGSVLAQSHNIAGIMVGGDYKKEKNPKIIEIITKEYDESNIMKIASEHTKKYRGKGTLLSNYKSLENDALMFNWNSMYWNKRKRLNFYNKFIKKVYIKDYDIKKSKNCGEVCPAVCKKVQKVHVKDYEPYSSCGPNLGIFTQEYAEKLVNTVDAMGFDAISFGNLLSTVFEAIEKNIIKPEDVGISEKPVFNEENFNINDSEKNSRIAVKLTRLAGFGKIHELTKGIRCFSEKNNINFSVYFRFGDNGVMSPNEYLRPGFVAPLPIIGKFTTFYGKEFVEPELLGEKCAERLIKELYNEDTGFCRFHRKWVEKIMPKMINELTSEDVNYKEHVKKVVNKIIKYNKLSNSLPKKWTGRAKDMVHNHLLVSVDELGETKTTNKWINKFNEDADQALNDYWNDLVKGITKVLGNDYKNEMD